MLPYLLSPAAGSARSLRLVWLQHFLLGGGWCLSGESPDTAQKGLGLEESQECQTSIFPGQLQSLWICREGPDYVDPHQQAATLRDGRGLFVVFDLPWRAMGGLQWRSSCPLSFGRSDDSLLELEKVLEVGPGNGAALRLMLSSHRFCAVHVTGKKAPFPPDSTMCCG